MGTIRNIVLKNVEFAGKIDAPSFFIYETENPKTENVVFENFIYKGKAVTSRKIAEECNFVIDEKADLKFI